jgi:hypothetical protein
MSYEKERERRNVGETITQKRTVEVATAYTVSSKHWNGIGHLYNTWKYKHTTINVCDFELPRLERVFLCSLAASI